MTIESTADQAAFMATFGVAVVLDGISITGIWDMPYLEELGIATAVPQVICVTSDIPSVAYNQTITVASVPFTGTVREIHPDGVGMTTLYLVDTT